MVNKRKPLGRNLDSLLRSVERKTQGERIPELATTGEEEDDTVAREAESQAPVAANESALNPNPTRLTAQKSDVNPPSDTADVARPSIESSGAAADVGDDASWEARRAGDRLIMIGVEEIRRSGLQPRRHFDEQKLQELANSLRAQGMLQPILVRPLKKGYELVAGERRWRAAQMAGLHDIPALVRALDDQTVAAIALVENLQREDLHPLEEAAAMETLYKDFGLEHQEIADALGVSDKQVANRMRLLELHEEVKDYLRSGELEVSAARALLGLPLIRQPEFARRAIQRKMTLRAVERMVRNFKAGKDPQNPQTEIRDPDVERLKTRLGEVLGAPVNIRHNRGGGGKLEIRYSSVSELEGIIEHIR